jgi:SAM-dependent methyltransferase
MGWKDAGEAWGARATDWAFYQESLCANSYDAVHQALEVGSGVRLLDVACGSGLALQRAHARGAQVVGVDASADLLRIAAERCPDAGLHEGDMAHLPFDDASFDVVTSFNGFMYGTDAALAEAARVLRSGGLLGMVFWQDPGDYLPHFQVVGGLLPPEDDTAGVPVRLSDPGVVEGMLATAGLDSFQRDVRQCVGLYPDLDTAYRGMAAASPAWAAIQHSGEAAFRPALLRAIDPYIDPVTGRVRMTATFSHVLARKPGHAPGNSPGPAPLGPEHR